MPMLLVVNFCPDLLAKISGDNWEPVLRGSGGYNASFNDVATMNGGASL